MHADGFEFVLARGDEGHVAIVDDGDAAAVGRVQGKELLRRRHRRVDRNDARALQLLNADFAHIDRVRPDDARDVFRAECDACRRAAIARCCWTAWYSSFKPSLRPLYGNRCSDASWQIYGG